MKKLILTLTIALLTVQPSLSETGKASYYSVRCNGGNRTASGEKLVDNANTAAHKTLPFGTLVKVTNLKNGKSEVVKITDRGPFCRGRIIDVAIGVAKKLGFIKNGIAPVRVEVVGKVKLKS